MVKMRIYDEEDPTIYWDVETKKCGRCSETKPVSEFYDSNFTSDNLLYYCMECQKDWVRENRKNHPEFHKAKRKDTNVTQPNVYQKKCSRCRSVKHRDEFHKDRRSGDGLSGYCKECRRIKNAEAYERKRES